MTRSSPDIVDRLENRAEMLTLTALNGRDTRLIKLIEAAAQEIKTLRATPSPIAQSSEGESAVAATPPNPMNFFTESVDAWGALQWFDRLAKAVRGRNAAVVAKDDMAFETCNNVASSSASHLVMDFEKEVRAALSGVAQGCGDPNCKDPNCTYGKGKPRCQNCGDPIAHGIYCGTCREMGCPVTSTEGK